jgi:iron complex outermembrane receptor protein
MKGWILGLIVGFAPLLAAADAEPQAGRTAAREEIDSAALEEERNTAVVTASGREEAKALAAANVTTVGWEEIARRRYRSLAEILGDLPGLYVIDDLVMPAVGVRGVTGGLRAGTRIVRVMINGVPVNFRPDLSAFLGPEYLPVEMIERVEVAKGPLSALYGANAFVATVNVITRGEGGATLLAEATARGLLHRGGSGGGGTLLGGYNDADRSVFVALTGEWMDRSGLAIRSTFPEQDPELARYRPFFAGPSRSDVAMPRGLFAQHISTGKTLGKLTLQGGMQRLDAMGEFQLNSVLTHESRVALQNDWLSARHERRWSDTLETAVWAGWSRGAPGSDERLFLTGNSEASFDRGFSYQAFDGAAELGLHFSESFQLKGGLDGAYEPQRVLYYTQTEAGSSVDLIGAEQSRKQTLSNFGAYLQASGTPLSDLVVTGNIRVDVPNLFPAQTSWRLALARRWSDTASTKLVAGRAFQTPSATLLFGLPGFGNANNVIGNRTLPNVLPLEPQVIESVEAAASLQLMGFLGLEGAVYGQQVRQKIEFVQSGANFQARNQGTQRGVGAELSARLALGEISLHLFGELFGMVAEGGIERQPPPLYPGYRFGSTVNLALPRAYLNINGRLVRVGERGASQSNVYLNNDTPYTLPPYTAIDLSVATLGLNFLGGAQTTIALTVRNLLDSRHSEPGFGGFDLPGLGRLFIFELHQAY